MALLPQVDADSRPVTTAAVVVLVTVTSLAGLAAFLLAHLRPGVTLALMLPLLALLCGVGTVAMRWRVRPLMREVVDSRNAAQRNEARFRAAAESSLDAFYIFECVRAPEDRAILDFTLVFVNPRGEQFMAVEHGQGVGRGLADFAKIVRAGGFLEKFSAVVNSAQAMEEEFPIQPWSGPAYWLHHQAVPLGDGVAVTIRDITERKRGEARLAYLAQNDTLTGLANRAAFLERLRLTIESAHTHSLKQHCALLYLDIDHFKHINDSLGHGTGDVVLQSVAARLTACVRYADTVARLGGDEFTVLLQGLESHPDADRVVRAIMASMREPVVVDGQPIAVSVSIGVAHLEGGELDNALDADGLLKRADAALYEVKRAGRNGAAVYAAGAAAQL